MADIFTTDVLTRVVSFLPQPNSFLLDKFFTQEQRENTEEIHFDIEDGKRRIAPFVSPVVQGKIVEAQGFHAATFKPAYVKPKTVFDINRPLKRSMGEQIGGTLSPMARLERAVNAVLVDHINMVVRRLEVMASEALRLGQVTVAGEQYPTKVVNFGRDAALTVVLAGGARWGQAGIKPLDLLQDWAQLVMQKCGAIPTEVCMTSDVWKVFRADADVKTRLDRFRGNSTMVVDAQVREGGVFMGTIDGFNIYVMGGQYVDDNGAVQELYPLGTVLLGGSQIEGVRAFGAIRDEAAGYQAMPYFPKSWVEQDPPVRYVMTQSAPLTVPYRVNASFCATVL